VSRRSLALVFVVSLAGAFLVGVISGADIVDHSGPVSIATPSANGDNTDKTESNSSLPASSSAWIFGVVTLLLGAFIAVLGTSVGSLTSKERLDTLTSFLQTFVSWPFALLIIIILIHDRLPDMIDRISKIGPEGIELEQAVATAVATQQAPVVAAQQRVVATQEVLQQQQEKSQQEIEQLRQCVQSSPAGTPVPVAAVRADLDDFREYLKKVGFTLPSEPEIEVTTKAGCNAFYSLPEHVIRIGPELAPDPDVVRHEYAAYELASMRPKDLTTLVGREIQNGLADYYTGSSSGDPRLAEIFQPPYVRNLDNEATLSGLSDADIADIVARGGDMREVWGGAFWGLRSLLGQERADRVLRVAWSETDRMITSRSDFVERIITAAANDGEPDMSAEIRDLFVTRGLLASDVVDNRDLTATVVATP